MSAPAEAIPVEASFPPLARSPTVVRGPMQRHAMLLVLCLACGSEALPPEDCEPPLPATNDDGEPWPTYAEANASLCERAAEVGVTVPRRGTCGDGKLFLELSGGFTGETQYFRDEALVGVLRYTDVVLSCSDYRFGDARCEPESAEDVVCP